MRTTFVLSFDDEASARAAAVILGRRGFEVRVVAPAGDQRWTLHALKDVPGPVICIELRGRAVEASGTEIRFADGSALSPTAVIWATGFALDHAFIQATVFDENGHVEHRRGVTAVPSLYFLGLPWQHTRGSALLGWVKDDAQYIASEIARAATPVSEPPALRQAA